MTEKLSERMWNVQATQTGQTMGIPGKFVSEWIAEVAALEARCERLEQENRVLRANASKSTLRRLEAQGAIEGEADE